MIPNSELQNMDLIDLVSERHTQLRKLTEKAWNEESDIPISNSEWYILARIYRSNHTIPQLTRTVNISRQAIHKFVKGLSAKGIVEILDASDNKKEKIIRMTPLGNECYEKNEEMKARLVQELASNIGVEQVETLKAILKLDWKL